MNRRASAVKWSAKLGIPVRPLDSIEEVVRRADIAIGGTTRTASICAAMKPIAADFRAHRTMVHLLMIRPLAASHDGCKDARTGSRWLREMKP